MELDGYLATATWLRAIPNVLVIQSSQVEGSFVFFWFLESVNVGCFFIHSIINTAAMFRCASTKLRCFLAGFRTQIRWDLGMSNPELKARAAGTDGPGASLGAWLWVLSGMADWQAGLEEARQCY